MKTLVAQTQFSISNIDNSYTIILTNEAQQFATNSSRIPTVNASYYTDVTIYHGTRERKDFTIGTVTSAYGISITKSGSRVTFAVNTGTALTADSGIFTIPITIDGKNFSKIFSWSCSKQGPTGATGSTGAAAKSVDITATTQVFKSTDGGTTFSPDTINLTPLFQGGISFGKWQYSINGGTSWADVASGSNGLTIASGVLTIAKTCSLFTNSLTALSFKCISNNASYFDVMTVLKLYDVTDIEIGGRNLLYKYIKAGGQCTKIDDLTINVGTNVGDTYFYLKPYCDLLSGETYTLSCEASNVPTGCDWTFGIRVQNSPNQLHIDKNGKCFVICKWDSQTGENTEFIIDDYQGRPATAPNIILKNFKLERGNVATDWTPAPEDIDAEFKTVHTSYENVKHTADENAKFIQDKAYQNDIYSVTDKDGNPVRKTLIDTLVQSTLDISGINRTVSSVQTDIQKKFDGTIETTLSKKIAEQKQSLDGFKTTVSNTYSTKTDLSNATSINAFTKANGIELFPQTYRADTTAKPFSQGGYTIVPATTISGGNANSSNLIKTVNAQYLYTEYIPCNVDYPFYWKMDAYNLSSNEGTIYIQICFYDKNKASITENEGAINILGGVTLSAANTWQTLEGWSSVPGQTDIRRKAYYCRIRYLPRYSGKTGETYIRNISFKQLAGNQLSQILENKTEYQQLADKFTWLVQSGTSASTMVMTDSAIKAITNKFIIKSPDGSATIIQGGKILANTITSKMLASDAIKSNNYLADQGSTHYSLNGTFIDLSSGSIKTPGFGTDASGNAYFKGAINAFEGYIGENDSNHWEIGTTYDENWEPVTALVATGNASIKAGKWLLTSDKISSCNDKKYVYKKSNNTYYDVGVMVPVVNTDDAGYLTPTISDNFLYIRKHASSVPDTEDAWDYLFRVDYNGNIYENGLRLNEKYASIDGVSGAYLPLKGGTISGNLTVTGTLNATAKYASQVTNALTINGKSFNGSSAVNVGTIGVGYGGTGKTSWTTYGIVYASSASALGQLPNGTSGYILKANGNAAPTWVAQSTLTAGNATKATQDASGNVITATYMRKDGGDFSGTVNFNADAHFNNTLYADDTQIGNMIVNGSARFINGITGNVTGNLVGIAAYATQLQNARTFTIGNTGKSFNATSNLSWTVAEIGAAPASHTHNYAGSSSSGGYANGTYTNFSLVSDNEIRFTKPSTSTIVHFGYKWTDGTLSSLITGYKFEDGNATLAPVYASTFYGTLSGNATTASKWATARNLALTGAVTGSVNIDGAGNVSLATTPGKINFAGTDNYIAYPDGGRYSTTTTSMTGYLKITLPQSWTNTMMSFTITIYDYSVNTSTKYFVSGYNYSASSSWSNCTVYAVGNNTKLQNSNYKVQFGHDGTKCAIYIGESTTKWNYPQISISDITLGYSNATHGNWKSGWSISFTTTLGTISVAVANPSVMYKSSMADQLTNARTINGTNFNGTGNITTAKWGTARNLALGNATKSIDGSANITFTLSEIGAATSGHTHSHYASKLTLNGVAYNVASNNIDVTRANLLTAIGAASGSNAGTMSAADKSKLDSITVSDIGTVGANSIKGSGAIGVVISKGIATISHGNSGVTAGSYGASSSAYYRIPNFTVNANGHVTVAGYYDITAANLVARIGSTAVNRATADASGNTISTTYLKKANDTWTGVLNAPSGVYSDTYTGALNMNNSNIYGINSLIFADLSDSAAEGIQFYRDATHVDTLWAKSGILYFTPNRALGSQTTDHIVLHTSNYTSYVPTKTGSGASGTWGISVTGNAATATKWQTARSIKIGNTAKNLDGTANLTWTHAEIGVLPLTGGTLSGLLTVNKGISLPTSGGTWVSGMTQTQLITFTGNSTGSYHPMIKYVMNSGNVVNIGALGTYMGFFGYKNGRTENAFDSKAVLDTSDGKFYATGFVGPLTGNSLTATTLQTSRTINGTSFNGSANITTAIWGTTRTITIGNTGKSVNGSGNVAWTLAEIGAAAASHSHSYLPLSGGTISGNLAVTGTTTFSGRTTHNGGIQSTTGAFSSTLAVSGTTTLSGATSVTNATASTSKSTGALKVSGGAGIAGQMSAGKVMIGDKVTLEYNTVNECLDFVFN